MTSKSWPMTNTIKWRVSSKPLGHHTYPVIYTVKNCTLKRRSEESLERATKRSRKSSDPDEGCSFFWREPQSSFALVSAGLYNRTGSTSSSSGERKKSEKRKSTPDDSIKGLRKRSRETPSPSYDHTQTFGRLRIFSQDAGTPVPIGREGEEKRSQKRKSKEGTQEPKKRSRKTPSPSEGPSNQTATPADSTDKPGTSLSVNTAPTNSRVAFANKYEEQQQFKRGGFGRVCAGYRKYDNMPVAIKHILQSDVERIAKYIPTGREWIPLEVALMHKLKPAKGETSATVELLDWYDLDNELILVLERPIPCMDLGDYLYSRSMSMTEQEAKIIVKQLVDAVIEVHSKGVFHRDIKLENILIETGSDVPRVRLIDFGCGTYLRPVAYFERKGTLDYFSVERFRHRRYRAEPITVWQIGVVVFAMLHGELPFNNEEDVISKSPVMNENLSSDCQGFILSCLEKKPEARPTLETLKHHPWLV